MSKVAILMSTYNGERYLAEQLDSIVNQTYRDWTLYIRDDGSKDATREILRAYAKRDPQINYLEAASQQNLGVKKSFFSLLATAEADYYMFSDQDDVWHQDKVEVTLHAMQEKEQAVGKRVPINVFTNLELVDATLAPMQLMNGATVKDDFFHLLYRNVVTGCTMMVNEALKQKLKLDQIDVTKLAMHDWWIGLVAALFGENVYVAQPTIKYRQHGDNVAGGIERVNTLTTVLHRIANLTDEKVLVLIVEKFSYELKRLYAEELRGKEKQYVYAYAKIATSSNFALNFQTAVTCQPYSTHPWFFNLIMLMFARSLKVGNRAKK